MTQEDIIKYYIYQQSKTNQGGSYSPINQREMLENMTPEKFKEIQNALTGLKTSQKPLQDYYDRNVTGDDYFIPEDQVNQLSPDYYEKMQNWYNVLSENNLSLPNLTGNVEDPTQFTGAYTKTKK